jgi:hypothetical protein
MQLSASEQHRTMFPASEPYTAASDLEAAARAVRQQKLASADDHSINPLSEAGVLQRVLD